MFEWYFFPPVALGAYLLGCLNSALVVSLWILKDDIRAHGSGNAGLTNIYRTFGPKWALAVIGWDLAKGVGTVLLARWLLGSDYAGYFAGLFVILGHIFPVFFHWKGGKGVLTACAVLLTVDPLPALVSLGVFAIVVAFTRYVSLGSIFALVALPLAMTLFGRGWEFVVTSALLAVLVILMHRSNIGRLFKGTERRFSFRR